MGFPAGWGDSAMARHHRVGAILLILAAAGFAFAVNPEQTSAQSPKSAPKEHPQAAPKADPETPTKARRIVRRGDECVRKGDAHPGVVRRDACGCWYCGEAGERDIIELNPNLATKFRCTWRLEGDRCLCRRTVAKAKVNESKTAPKAKKKAGKAK